MATLSLDRVAVEACSRGSSRRYLAAENKRLLAELTNARDQHARFDEREAALSAREQKVAEGEKNADVALADANAFKAKWEGRMAKLNTNLADMD